LVLPSLGTFVCVDPSKLRGGIWTKWWCGLPMHICTFGEQWTMTARFWMSSSSAGGAERQP
jgi:hypothetical protein